MSKLLGDRPTVWISSGLIGISLLWAVWYGGRPTATASLDDCWRRTTAGWEWTDGWHAAWPTRTSAVILPPHRSLADGPRYDSHPAALALAEIVLIVLGFYAFPAGRKAASETPAKSWSDHLLASFRASAFGA